MSAPGVEPSVPRWAWYAGGATVFAGVIGAVVFAARRPGYDRLLRRTGAPAQLRWLAAIQRYTESRGNPKAGLGRPELFPWWAEPRNAPRHVQEAESDAAERGYEYNQKSYGESPYPKRMWIFGSGGPYGMLPSTALGPWRHTDDLRRGKVTPYDVFNPWRATVFFVDYAYRLTQREDFRSMPPVERNLLALKRGMASPKLVADYREQQTRSRTSRRKAEEAIDALGLGEKVLHTQIPLDWPSYRGARELVP